MEMQDINREIAEYIDALGFIDGKEFIEVRAIDTGGKVVQNFYRSREELLGALIYLDGLNKNGYHVYIGVAPRVRKGGKDADIESATCIWLDIDTRETHPDATYTDKKEALTALLEFPLPPSMVVDSGGGIQVYWRLKERLPLGDNEKRDGEKKLRAIIKGLAQTLQGDLSKHNPSAVFRLPGFINHKNGKIAKILQPDNGVRYDLAEFQPYIREAEENQCHQIPYDGPTGDANLAVMQCSFFRHCKEHAESLTEPLWFSMITNLARMKGGIDLCHEFSEPYPGYSFEETEKKIRHALDTQGPHTCVIIRDNTGFEGCPPEGCGVKAPAVLGLKQNVPLMIDSGAEYEHILDAICKIKLEGKREEFVKYLSKNRGIRTNAVRNDLEEIIRQRAIDKIEDPGEIWTDDEKEKALIVLQQSNIIQEFLKTCKTKYRGRENALILLKLATISRKFDRGISVIITGTPSVGKSELVVTVLKTVLSEDRKDFTRISENYLLYTEDSLDHKVITFYELRGTGEAAHIIRTALTEGRLTLGSVGKTKNGFGAIHIDKSSEGLVIISTLASGRIDPELDTRVVKIELSHDTSLAREVLRHKSNDRSAQEEIVPFKVWQVVDHLLEPADISIPFAHILSELFPVEQERFMRDFEKVLGLIRASALLHQFQRERDGNGLIIATRGDYELIYSLRDLIAESVSAIPDHIARFLKAAQEFASGEKKQDMPEDAGEGNTKAASDTSDDSGKTLPTREALRIRLDVSEATIKRYITECVKKDLIEISGKGKKQTIKVVEIPDSISPLPSPENVFPPNDPISQADDSFDPSWFDPDHDTMIQDEPMNDISDLISEHTYGSSDQNSSLHDDPGESQQTQESIEISSPDHDYENDHPFETDEVSTDFNITNPELREFIEMPDEDDEQ